MVGTMADASIPPGWSHNPSAWSRRLPVFGLAAVGCAIATYLGLYQLDVVHGVWEPFFGDGSYRILKGSSIAHLLPIPDALLGAGAYFAEAVAELIGGSARWRTLPWAVLATGCVAVGLGLTGIVLAVCQPALFHAGCTLCLTSAALSITIACLAVDEVRATWRHLKST
jgi:hypothetical protein